MYYKLIDLIRSPELIKMITKECDECVGRNRDQHIKGQVWVVKRKMHLEKIEKLKKKEKKRQELEKERRAKMNNQFR